MITTGIISNRWHDIYINILPVYATFNTYLT